MRIILIFLFFGLSLSQLYAQVPAETKTDTNTYVITKSNGTEYIGKVISDDGREVLITTATLGKIYIPKSDIKSIVKVTDNKSIVRGEYYSAGPFTTRHAFTTNALPISKGENYALINLYGPEVHFAVTDHLNIGIMSTWSASPLVLALKYTIPTNNEKLNFSLGTLLGTSGYFNSFRGFGGLHFANVTYGDRKNNVTFSAGYGYTSSFGSKELITPGTYTSTNGSFNYSFGNYSPGVSKGPIISIAAIVKVGVKASFVFDSMFGAFSRSATRNDIGTTNTIVEATPPDYNNGLYQQTVGISKVNSSKLFALFLMPGMRFQTKENRAFQVSLAGVTVFGQEIENIFGLNSISFPLPLFSWFFKF
ncbi:MAG: hypothetical protein K9G36_10160 [Crocinitomicaceae bacterium]|nr:hypothetical protein [Crocinitomicaceae bacterium]MCF8409920.1 hypothetical protein [Crocinitomicaceae bacterium]MCF8444659.1 hypothetical protein [Crocinitomicaceae bacterium]